MLQESTVSEVQELWDKEYKTLHVIPSSSRAEPSKALLLLASLLDLQPGMKVLDLGCGNGRNSIFLARQGCEVHAVDVSGIAVQECRSRAEKEGVDARIHTHRQSFFDPLPLQNDSFDLVLDIYVLCHLLTGSGRREYLELMSRMVKSDGRVISVVFSNDDEYYQAMPRVEPSIVEDPINGIAKRLFTEIEIKSVYEHFDLEYFLKFEFDDTVLGKTFRRRIYTSILRNRVP